MYKYSKKSCAVYFIFSTCLILSAALFQINLGYRVVIGLISLLILKDAFKELNASFEITGDRMIIKSKGEVIREILYKDMKYLTITRKNKSWIVIADDNRILFTIKPTISNYKAMVKEIILANKSNRKLEIHDYIKKTYSK